MRTAPLILISLLSYEPGLRESMMKTGAFLASLAFNSSTVMRGTSPSVLCSAVGVWVTGCSDGSAGVAGVVVVTFADFLAFDLVFDFVVCASAMPARASIATSSSAHFLNFMMLLLCGFSGVLILPCRYRRKPEAPTRQADGRRRQKIKLD